MSSMIEKVHDARYKIFIQEPFFGYILQHVETSVQDDIDTAYTDGKTIVIGAEFLEDLSMKDTMFILLHELMHIVLKHVHRRGDRQTFKYNIACDIVVNEIIKAYGFKPDKLEPVSGEKYDINGFAQTVEEAYDKLPFTVHEVSFDSHQIWDSITNQSNGLDQVIIDATTKGYTPRGPLLKRVASDVMQQHKRVEWQRVLEQYISKSIQDYTYQRIDYRYPDVLLPSYDALNRELHKVWFLIDVSGSVSDELLSEFYSEMVQVINRYQSVQCDVSFFSTYTTRPTKIRNVNELLETMNDITSRMGTNFRQIFTSMDKYYPGDKPKLMIVFTDGYASYPSHHPNPTVPIIWTIYQNKTDAPFGQTIHL